MTDREIHALLRRDATAWDEFYRRQSHEVYGFVFRLLAGDAPAAEDLFQDIWLEAIDGIEQFDPQRGKPRAWLFGIARRKVALYWRRRVARRDACAADESIQDFADNEAILPDEIVGKVEQADVVRAALLMLSEERRKVLVSKYVQGLSVQQIATRQGKTASAVESLLARAREQFRSLLRWYFHQSETSEK